MIVIVAVITFLAGTAVGGLLVARNTHRLLARLPGPERVAFARKVNSLARR